MDRQSSSGSSGFALPKGAPVLGQHHGLRRPNPVTPQERQLKEAWKAIHRFKEEVTHGKEKWKYEGATGYFDFQLPAKR